MNFLTFVIKNNLTEYRRYIEAIIEPIRCFINTLIYIDYCDL